jgi:hypothetical protein
MTNTTFVDNQTVIEASWLNDVNDAVYNKLGDTFGVVANGDVSKTITVGVDPMHQQWNSLLTIDRTVTASGTGAINGSRFVISRGPGTGPKSLFVSDGITTLATLHDNQTCELIFSGTAWTALRAPSQVALSVKNFGAYGDGIADDTAAIQAAMDTGNAVYIPAGTYNISTSLKIKTYGQKIYGDGQELSILKITGTSDCFTMDVGRTLNRIHFSDFQILGTTNSGIGINIPSTCNTYMSTFHRMFIVTGQQCMYMPTEFSTTFYDIQFSSFNNHGLELSGGNSTTLTGCYAHSIPTTGKCGYRLYNGATFIGCNGLDAGDTWGIFGQGIARGDPQDNQFNCVFIRCNFEDFKKVGVRFRYTGSAVFNLCTFLPPTSVTSATYDACIWQEYSDQMVTLIGTRVIPKSPGATRTKLADYYMENGLGPIVFGNNTGFTSYDNNTTLTSAAIITTSGPVFAVNGININNLVMGRGWGFYSPAISTWTANASSFSVAGLDRVKTANTVATNLDFASGGVDGQMLIVHVRDSNTTIRNQVGGGGSFITSSGTNKLCVSGRPYMFIYDGTFWREVSQVSTGTSTKTANYSIVAGDYTIRGNAVGGAFTVTLPVVAAAQGQVYNIKKIDSSINAVTVKGNGSDTIDGSNTQVITRQYDSLTVQSNGTSWDIL